MLVNIRYNFRSQQFLSCSIYSSAINFSYWTTAEKKENYNINYTCSLKILFNVTLLVRITRKMPLQNHYQVNKISDENK